MNIKKEVQKKVRENLKDKVTLSEDWYKKGANTKLINWIISKGKEQSEYRD